MSKNLGGNIQLFLEQLKISIVLQQRTEQSGRRFFEFFKQRSL